MSDKFLTYNKPQLQKEKLINQLNKLIFYFHLDYLSSQLEAYSRRISNGKLAEREKFVLKNF